MLVLPGGEWTKPREPPPLSQHGVIARAAWRVCGRNLERLPVYAAICRVLDFELTLELWIVIAAVEDEGE